MADARFFGPSRRWRRTATIPVLASRAKNIYVPSAFAETDPANIHKFMRRNSFAVLTSHVEGGLTASHLPLLLVAGASAHGVLLGHMARANSQGRKAEGEVMAVFSGPHAYVSPSWNEEGGTVPTWNYVAVHAYGTFQVVEDRGTLLEILRRSVRTYEAPMPGPWAFDESAPHVEALLKAIIGFRIEITRLEGERKLSQNHPEGRRRRVVRALSGKSDEDSQAVAAMMAELPAGAEGGRGDPGADDRPSSRWIWTRTPPSRTPRAETRRSSPRCP
jgi:transcriptional regulator